MMLIRTQDRGQLVVLENVTGIIIDRFEDDFFINAILSFEEDPFNKGEHPTWTLGWYSSDEKALKVLDKIQYWYDFLTYRGLANANERNDIPCPTPVFQMPQDDEVEA